MKKSPSNHALRYVVRNGKSFLVDPKKKKKSKRTKVAEEAPAASSNNGVFNYLASFAPDIDEPHDAPEQQMMRIRAGSISYRELGSSGHCDLEAGNLHNENESDSETESAMNPTVSSAVTKRALQERHHLEFLIILCGGSALAFNAGYVNGCAMLISNMTVSHVTGTSSRIGIDLANEHFDQWMVDIAVIMSFIGGAALAGALLRVDVETFSLTPSYGNVLLAGALLFFLATLAAVFLPSETRMFIYLAAMGCGLQNSITTWYSGNIIRTTHLTGAATDIGIVLGRAVRTGGETLKKDGWKLLVLIPLFVSFIFGSMISVQAVRIFGRWALMTCCVAFLVLGALYIYVIKRQLHTSFWGVFFSFYRNNVEETARVVKNGVMEHVVNPLNDHLEARRTVAFLHKKHAMKRQRQEEASSPMKSKPLVNPEDDDK